MYRDVFLPRFFFALTTEKAFQIPRKLLFIQSWLNIIEHLQSGLLEAAFLSFSGLVLFCLVYRLPLSILLCLAIWFLIKDRK